MKKSLFAGLAVGALMLGFAGTVSAYTINYISASATDGSVLTTKNSWATVYDFNKIGGTFPATILDATYVTGFSSGVYAAPATAKDFNHIDSTQYLTIGGGKTTTIKFSASENYLGLFWGSMDSYNTLELWSTITNSLVLSLTGSDVTGGTAANGAQYSSPTNRYVNIYTTDLFDKIVMKSRSNAFEIDNLAVGTSPVPEPATMLLFGTGLIGLASAIRRKRS